MSLLKILATLILVAAPWSTKMWAQEIVEVGGILQEDTFWSKDFIYVVTEDVIAIAGVRLEIGQGTEVRFNQGRGILIEGGGLLINGTFADSVRLLPNHASGEDWNWKGITISSITQPGKVSIKYATIKKAIVGIKANAGNHLSISNNSILNNRNVGISLINSSHAIIIENNIAGNFLGLEIFSTDPSNQSSHTQVKNNRFSNPTTNLLIHNSNQGGLLNNVISENLIQDGTHGIWLFKSGFQGAANVSVTRNIILNNGTANDGYGIYVSMDSAYITNNIFWENTTAVSFRTADHCLLANNSIYQNKFGVELRNSATGIIQLNNTIASNLNESLIFNAHTGMVFEGNNMFFDADDQHVFVNNTGFDISIPNNHWGTTDVQIIDDFILDKNDDPSLGLIVYDPILAVPDTAAPISPPSGVIVQQIGNRFRLKWQQNTETDLLGYRVYYGNFADYAFSQSSEITGDTVFFPEQISSFGEIAVTALDKNANAQRPQLSGNESPFSFATPMPYAGQDTTICKNEQFFRITESTIPYDYDVVEWLTSGDGTFNDNGIFYPDYFPGLSDLENGIVKLVLKVLSGEVQKSDSLRIFFANPPIVFAGNDGLVSPDSLFKPSGGFAFNYHELNWLTTGDGTFADDGSLETNYTPGNQDIADERVKLILKATSNYCGAVYDTLQLVIKRRFSVEGRVWAGNTWLSQNPVLAINMDAPGDGSNTLLQFTNPAGIFRFDGLFAGNYLFFAPADTNSPKTFFPAYHPNARQWENAYMHNLQGDTYDLDLRLIVKEFNLPDGIGKISGRFLIPGNMATLTESHCRAWFGNDGKTICDGGLSNIIIYLYGASGKKMYDFTLTDAQGKFQFANLPFGRYLLTAELAGYQSQISEVIDISPENPWFADVEVTIQALKKIGVFVPGNPSVSNYDLLVFPNPANRELFISGELFYNSLNPEILIYNAMGTPVILKTLVINDFASKIDISHLPSGIYFGLIKGQGYLNRFTFIKPTN